LARRSMPSYQPYSPEQAELLPAHVKDVLGADHLCFLVHEVVESLDLSGFEKEGEDEGGQRAYDPRLMLKVWLYGFGVNVRTTRKMEQRIGEDLGFRYLAGGAAPDHKTLSEFQRRHHAAIAELFTQVLMVLRRAGQARLGGGDRLDAGEGVGFAGPRAARRLAGAGVAEESAALAEGTGR
jgi:transposase